MSETIIHHSSFIEEGARIGSGVRIGPFCHVSSDATIGDNVELKSHVVVHRATSIGEGTIVWPFASLGGAPQSFAHKGGDTTLVIGKNCEIREHVTMNVGSDVSRGTTVVGDNGYFMAYAHIAHDCIVGNNVTMANCATLGGHAVIGDNVILSGLSAVHQFVRVGHHAFLGGTSTLVGDLIPYGLAVGDRAELRGFNLRGLKRSGIDRSELKIMREAYDLIFEGEATFAENLAAAEKKYSESHYVAEIINFLRSRGQRHYCLPIRNG